MSNISTFENPRWATISPYYFIVINSSKHGIVKARIPDSISLSVESTWSDLFHNPNLKIAEFMTAIFGVSTVTEVASLQVWQGTSPIQVSLDLEFAAESNAREEIIENIRKLGRMVLPRRGTEKDTIPQAFLRAPGPRLKFSLSNLTVNLSEIEFDPDSDVITIEIGGFLRFRGVILTSMDTDFDGSILRDGYPSHARCRIQFRTFFVIVSETFDQLFLGEGKK